LCSQNAALTNAVFLKEKPVGGIDVAVETAALDVQTKALGVSQHHDAITSSQRRHVHRDYIKSLSIGQASVDASISRVVAAAIAGAANATLRTLAAAVPTLVTCPYLNESTCPASTTKHTASQRRTPSASLHAAGKSGFLQRAVRGPVSGMHPTPNTSPTVKSPPPLQYSMPVVSL
jgi:hypothetical protein